MIVELSELLRVHPELARHLHVSMREMESSPCVHPGLEILRKFLRCHGRFLRQTPWLNYVERRRAADRCRVSFAVVGGAGSFFAGTVAGIAVGTVARTVDR